jgi:hypothetical protein
VKIKRKEFKGYILALDFKDGLGIVMEAIFSIPVVVKVRCIPTARFRSMYFFYRWHTYGMNT